MDKFIYAVYLVVTFVGLSIGLRIVWSLARRRRVDLGPLAIFLTLIGLVAAYYFWERQDVYARLEEARVARADAAESPIYIAAVWPADEPEFFDGMRRAVDTLNAGSGVQVRDGSGNTVDLNVNLIEFRQKTEDDGTYLDVADDDRIMAVVGHRSESEAISASAAYQEAGLLYLAPTVSRPTFSEHGFDRVLRLVPDDDVIANRIAKYIASRGYRDIIVLTPRTETGKNMARYLTNVFRTDGKNRNRVDVPRVVMYRSYEPGATRFHELATQVLGTDHSAILIADDVVGTATLVRELRTRNVDSPIFAFPSVEVKTFFDITGPYSDGVVIPSLLPLGEGDAPAMAATPPASGAEAVGDADARAILSTDPDPAGFVEAQALEAVMLLAQAWERADTIDPSAVAAILRGVKGWQGRYGSYDFLPNGDVSERAIQMKQSIAGQFYAIQD